MYATVPTAVPGLVRSASLMLGPSWVDAERFAARVSSDVARICLARPKSRILAWGGAGGGGNVRGPPHQNERRKTPPPPPPPLFPFFFAAGLSPAVALFAGPRQKPGLGGGRGGGRKFSPRPRQD